MNIDVPTLHEEIAHLVHAVFPTAHIKFGGRPEIDSAMMIVSVGADHANKSFPSSAPPSHATSVAGSVCMRLVRQIITSRARF